MDIFRQKREQLKVIDEAVVSRELFEFARKISSTMVQMNRDQIEKESRDIHGNAIGFYSTATELISGGKKKAGDPFTGRDTGEWLSKFYMGVHGTVLHFGSTDPKTDDILDSPHWLSADLFGLSDENLQEVVNEYFLPFVLDYFKKALL